MPGSGSESRLKETLFHYSDHIIVTMDQRGLWGDFGRGQAMRRRKNQGFVAEVQLVHDVILDLDVARAFSKIKNHDTNEAGEVGNGSLPTAD